MPKCRGRVFHDTISDIFPDCVRLPEYVSRYICLICIKESVINHGTPLDLNPLHPFLRVTVTRTEFPQDEIEDGPDEDPRGGWKVRSARVAEPISRDTLDDTTESIVDSSSAHRYKDIERFVDALKAIRYVRGSATSSDFLCDDPSCSLLVTSLFWPASSPAGNTWVMRMSGFDSRFPKLYGCFDKGVDLSLHDPPGRIFFLLLARTQCGFLPILLAGFCQPRYRWAQPYDLKNWRSRIYGSGDRLSLRGSLFSHSYRIAPNVQLQASKLTRDK